MAGQTQKLLLGVAAVVAVVVLGWLVWSRVSDGSDTDRAPRTVPVLCANDKCGYSGEVEPKDLVFAAGASMQPARAPIWGPGYKCPKCGENTLYTGSIKCSGCGAPFLPSFDASGSVVRKCPKCGKMQ